MQKLVFARKTFPSTIPASRIPTLLIASAKVLDQMLAGPQGKRQDRNCCGLIRAKREYAGVAHIEICDVVGLTKTVSDKFLRIVTETVGGRGENYGRGNPKGAASRRTVRSTEGRGVERHFWGGTGPGST